MRTLTDAFKGAQKQVHLKNLVKIVFTRTGQTTYTCLRSFAVEGAVTPDGVVLGIDHTEEQFHQQAKITLLNLASDGSKLNWNLLGYKVQISSGLLIGGTATYSERAPLWVKDDSFYSSPGKLTLSLYAIGLTDILDRDLANASFYNKALLEGGVTNPHNTATVQTLINALCTVNGVQTGVSKVFNHCANVTADWGTLDSLMNVFIPKDSFSVLAGESRMQVIRRLLQLTSMVLRVENDGHLNFFVPTTTGSTYDYQYELQLPTQTLRPAGVGAETAIGTVSGSVTHWGAVDEDPASDTDYVENSLLTGVYQRDIYSLPDLSATYAAEGIASVTVFARARQNVKLAVRTGGVTYDSPEIVLGTSLEVTSWRWTMNPGTGLPWVPSEIDLLTAGVSLASQGTQTARCTQLYVEVVPRPHQFFQKYRKSRQVQPNYIVVTSRPKDMLTTVVGDIQAPGFALGVSQIVVENISSGGAIIAGTTFTIAGHAAPYLVTSSVLISGGAATIQFTPALTAAANTGDDVTLYYGYYGLGQDTGSVAYEQKDLYEALPVTTTAQADLVAEAILDWFQLHNPKGTLIAPENAGQEIYDYININDERETPSLAGNVGKIRRVYSQKRSTIAVTLGNDNLMSYKHVRDIGSADEPDYETVLTKQRQAIIETAQQIEAITKIIEAQSRSAAPKLPSLRRDIGLPHYGDDE